MGSGKLFWDDRERLRMLGLLLENCGAEAAVRMSNPDVWRAAVARLADEDATLERAVDAACRWRASFDIGYDLLSILSFDECCVTDDYVERTDFGVAERVLLIEQARERNAGKRPLSPDFSTANIRIETLRRDGAEAVAMVRQETKHHRYAPVPENPKGSQPLVPFTEVERWRESWGKQDGGWRLRFRERVGSPTVLFRAGRHALTARPRGCHEWASGGLADPPAIAIQ